MGSTVLNDDSVSSKKEMYKKLLNKLECPFTWNMDNIDKSIDIDHSPHDEEESIPLVKLLRTVMTVYVDVKDSEDNSEAIIKNLKKCDDALKKSEDPEISTKVVTSVLQATKCFVYFELDMQKELEVALAAYENLDDMNDKEKSTLFACNSICWSKYHRAGSGEAKQLIQKAIELNGNCALWYFILGKNLRRQRRGFLSYYGKPTEEEENCFCKAYQMSENPIYGIFAAQMYREKKDYFKASQMSEVIFKKVDSLSNAVLLRLALGFIRMKKLDQAKICLDKAEKTCAENSMYLHYRGIYYMKRKQFAVALHFFKKAIEENNLPAEKQYLECMVKNDKSFKVTQYLLGMLDRYGNLPGRQIQSLIVDLAFSYWKRERDLKEALKYFLQAIEIDPEAKLLRNGVCTSVTFMENNNVYFFLEKHILPVIRQKRNQYDKETLERADAIKKFCISNNKTQINNIAEELTLMGINK